MLCSGNELNISDDSEGIIELKNRENDIGKNYFKSKGEKSIDISVTPNRPDCLGVRGIARDLASAGLGKFSNLKKIKIKQSFKQPIKISITKEKNQGCLNFGGCYIKNIQNKEILRIKVSGEKIVNGEIYILESDFDYLFSIVNGKINEGIIRNLFTTIRNDNKKIDISFKIPDRVLTGSKYDIDIILNKPLEEVIIAGAIKPHQVNSLFEQEILLEPLASGGIFKITRAPSKPGIQIWSGIIAHPEGMITFTKSIDIVDKI